VLTQSNSSKNNKSSDTELNKEELYENRGVDFIINGGKRKQPKRFMFKRIVRFLSREVSIYFEFSFQSKKIK